MPESNPASPFNRHESLPMPPSSDPDPVALRALVAQLHDRSVAWLCRNLDCFSPLTAPADEGPFAHKALLELALLAAYMHRLDPARLSSEREAMLDHVAAIAAQPAYYELAARDHGALLLYGLTYAALHLCNREHAEYRHVLAQSLATRHALLAERIPYRQLDLLHFLALSELAHDRPGAAATFRHTLLAGRPNVVELSDSDAYAITHTLFYMTDFGLRRADWGDDFAQPDAATLVEALLRHYRQSGNADLVAELIASTLCLGSARSDELAAGWHYLAAQQEADGRIAGPAGIIDEARCEAEHGAPYRQWKTAYHTNIVVALAAAMWLRAGRGDYPLPQPGTTQPQPACPVTPYRDALTFLCTHVDDDELKLAARAGAGLALGIALPADHRPADHLIAPALRRLAQRIDDAAEPQSLWDEIGADTSLLLAWALRSHAIECAALNALLSHLSGQIGSVDLVQFPQAWPACAFLQRLGWIDPPSAIPPRIATARTGDEPVLSYATRLLALSGGDPARLEGAGDIAALTTELITSCKDYRLVDAALLIRTLALLGQRDDRVVRDAIAYLLSQQNAVGAFGYFASNADEATLLPLRLNWTLAVLWALCDVEHAEQSVSRRFAASA